MLTALKYNSANFPDRPFLEGASVEGDTVSRLSYAEFARQATLLAAGLRSHGLADGDRVLTFIPASPEYILTMFGLFFARLAQVTCSTLFTAPEIRRQLEHSAASAVIVSREHEALAREAASTVATVREILVWDLATGHQGDGDMNGMLRAQAEAGGFDGSREVTPDHLAMIIYTSGTTASPKGVMLTHGNLLWAAETFFNIYEYNTFDRVLHFFPMYHVGGGIALVMPSILTAASIVVAPRFTASRFAEVLVKTRATMAAINATHVKMILEHPETEADRQHTLLRAQYGLPLDKERFDHFEERFGIRLVEGYGLTEAMGIVTANRPWSMRRFGSVGPPVNGRSVRIVDENGRDVAPGETGEIWASWENRHGIMAGYYEDPAATHTTLDDGWLRTGDVGRIDEEGYVFFVGRQKDIIKRAGVNVAPAEIERALQGHPLVAAAAVVGIPDEIREEAIVAFVTTSGPEPPTADELREFCERELAAFKVPEAFLVVSKLPEDPLGKLDKKELRRMAIDQLRRA